MHEGAHAVAQGGVEQVLGADDLVRTKSEAAWIERSAWDSAAKCTT
ncbi:hypothetical protein STENM327S_04523 [Streptomyces tendae]